MNGTMCLAGFFGFFSVSITVQRLKTWLIMDVNTFQHIPFSNFLVEVYMLSWECGSDSIFFTGKTYLRDFILSSFS